MWRHLLFSMKRRDQKAVMWLVHLSHMCHILLWLIHKLYCCPSLLNEYMQNTQLQNGQWRITLDFASNWEDTELGQNWLVSLLHWHQQTTRNVIKPTKKCKQCSHNYIHLWGRPHPSPKWTIINCVQECLPVHHRISLRQWKNIRNKLYDLCGIEDSHESPEG